MFLIHIGELAGSEIWRDGFWSWWRCWSVSTGTIWGRRMLLLPVRFCCESPMLPPLSFPAPATRGIWIPGLVRWAHLQDEQWPAIHPLSTPWSCPRWFSSRMAGRCGRCRWECPWPQYDFTYFRLLWNTSFNFGVPIVLMVQIRMDDSCKNELLRIKSDYCDMHASIFIFTLDWGIAHHNLRVILWRIPLFFRTGKLWKEKRGFFRRGLWGGGVHELFLLKRFRSWTYLTLIFLSKEVWSGSISEQNRCILCLSTTEYSYVRKPISLHVMSCLSIPRNFHLSYKFSLRDIPVNPLVFFQYGWGWGERYHTNAVWLRNWTRSFQSNQTLPRWKGVRLECILKCIVPLDVVLLKHSKRKGKEVIPTRLDRPYTFFSIQSRKLNLSELITTKAAAGSCCMVWAIKYFDEIVWE